MVYHSYEVDPAFVKGGNIEWVNTGNGEFIIGKKRGRKYFIKRNLHIRFPSPDLPRAVYDTYNESSSAALNKQIRLRNLMKRLNWQTDHVVVEEENFKDEKNMLVTVTAFISDKLPDEYAFNALPAAEFLKLGSKMAELIKKIHVCGVIHGDLKEKNFVFVREGGDITPYLIDFDTSYPADAIPEFDAMAGTDGYLSPEVLAYVDAEGDIPADTITSATDVFTLGIIFHRLWTGNFPGVEIEKCSVGAAVYLEKDVTIDSKFNVRIGPNTGATLISLINWMFARDPANRPTAEQVVNVLTDRLEVPEEFHKGDDVKPLAAELWEAHSAIAEVLSVPELKEKKVKTFRRINEGIGSTGLKYLVVTEDGVEKKLDIFGLCEAGYASMKDASVETPWPEHGIEFASPDEIVRKGYSKISRFTFRGQKRYLISFVSGRSFDKGYEWLIAEGLARPRTVTVDADTPWPEHGTEYDSAALGRHFAVKISRVEVAGQHRYRIEYEMPDGTKKVNEAVSGNNAKLMGFVK